MLYLGYAGEISIKNEIIMSNNKIITRFAPSPTGFLHIGSARTALFNYLFARHYGGKFLLRIEDTDRERSTDAATKALLDGLKWLELDWDGDEVYQFARSNIHATYAKTLVEQGKAYYCFLSQEEIEAERNKHLAAGKHYIIDSPWRDVGAESVDISGNKAVVRLKAPRTGKTVIKDSVQGDVVVANDHLDDMVLLRSDGTPTYMLAVVVDDHEMGVTHIIRGDDHLTNAARQIALYEAFGWDVPQMAHIPLIHGPDGAKLSKRHGALGVEWYRDAGYLPEAICNYLLRLGWSHGDDEFISRKQAIEWFNVESIGKSPSRLDWDKMRNFNAHYIKLKDSAELHSVVLKALSAKYSLSDASKNAIALAIEALKPRCSLIGEMVDLAEIYIIENKPEIQQDAADILKNTDRSLIDSVKDMISKLEHFDHDTINSSLKSFAEKSELKLGDVMKPLRCMITGRVNSPSVFEIMAIIGKDAVLNRIA